VNPWIKKPTLPSKMSVGELLDNMVEYGEDVKTITEELKRRPVPEIRVEGNKINKEIEKKIQKIEEVDVIIAKLKKKENELSLAKEIISNRHKIIEYKGEEIYLLGKIWKLTSKLKLLYKYRKEV